MRTLWIAFATLLAGCAMPASRTAVQISAPMPLLPPAALGGAHSAQQVLHVAYGDQEATLSAVLTVSRDHLQVIGLNAVGLRLFTLDYDGAQLKTERMPGLPEQIDPARVLADLQLAFWPLTALQNATRDSEWRVSEPYARTRRLKRAGKLAAEVHYADGKPWQGRLWLSNYQFGYSLAVDSAEDR